MTLANAILTPVSTGFAPPVPAGGQVSTRKIVAAAAVSALA